MMRIPLVLTLVLVAMWLLLNNTLSFGQTVLGTVFAVLLVLAGAKLRPVRPRLRRLYLAAPLIAVVLVDILRSNLGVARIVLGLTGKRQVRSGFLDIPLELRDPHGLAILAVIITSTPGTAARRPRAWPRRSRPSTPRPRRSSSRAAPTARSA